MFDKFIVHIRNHGWILTNFSGINRVHGWLLNDHWQSELVATLRNCFHAGVADVSTADGRMAILA